MLGTHRISFVMLVVIAGITEPVAEAVIEVVVPMVVVVIIIPLLKIKSVASLLRAEGTRQTCKLISVRRARGIEATGWSSGTSRVEAAAFGMDVIRTVG